MVKVEKFYAGLLDMLNLKMDNSGTIMINHGGVDTPILVNGLEMVLPTTMNIKEAVVIKDGVPTPNKYIFNPLSESVVSGSNESLNKFKMILELKLLGTIFAIGENLFSILSDKDVEVNDIIISKYLVKLNRFKTSGVRQMIDGKTVSVWADLYNNVITKFDKDKFLSLYIKKGGLLDSVKYNRLGVITFPFIEALDKHAVKDGKFMDVSIRNKDKSAIVSLFEFLFWDKEELLNGKQYGSLNKISPSMHTLLMMYNDIYDSLKDILASLGELDMDANIKEMITLKPLPFNIATLSDIIEDLSTDVKQIPAVGDVTAMQNFGKTQEPVSNQQAITQQVEEAPKSYSNPWDKLASEGNRRPTAQANPLPLMQGTPINASSPVMQTPVTQPMTNPPLYGQQQIGYGNQQPVYMNQQQQQQQYGGPSVRQINPMSNQPVYGNNTGMQQHVPMMHGQQISSDPWV